MIRKYKGLAPFVVDAIQYTKDNMDEVLAFCSENGYEYVGHERNTYNIFVGDVNKGVHIRVNDYVVSQQYDDTNNVIYAISEQQFLTHYNEFTDRDRDRAYNY